MRRLGLRGGVATALVTVATALAASAGIAAASTSVWPAASAVELPVGAAAAQANTSLPSVSCGSSSQCVSVGGYDGASTTEPMAITATNGTWAQATTITPPSGAASSALRSVSCTAAGTCIAVGEDDAGAHPILASEASGVWTAATELGGLPSGASGGSLSGISCLPGNNCSAVGSDTVGGAARPMAISAAAGTFGQAVQVALPAGATSGSLTSVACTTPGNCVAVGSDLDAAGQRQAMVSSETAGSWGAGAQLALPTGASATQNAVLAALSCPSSGHCTAVGSYLNAAGQSAAMLATLNGTTWGQASALSLPAGTVASALGSISCTGTTSCTASGALLTNAAAPLAATESDGVWSAGSALSTPPGAVASGALSSIGLAVGCTAAERCDAIGTYPTAGGLGAMALLSHPSLTITSHSLPAGAIGTHYSARIATSGGTGSLAWALSGGSLPAGLTFDAATGVVSGTPTTDQTTTFTVAVSDGASPPDQASGTLSIRIGPATKPPKTTSSGTGTGKGSSQGKHKKKKAAQKGAKVGAVKVLRGSSVRFTLRCVVQRHCNGRVAVVVIEHLRGRKVTSINASTHRARGTRTRTIWLGSVRYALRGGHKVTRTIHLDRFGRHLLATRHRLTAGLALRPASFRRATIEHTLKLHRVKAKKHTKKHTKKHGSPSKKRG